MPAADLVIAGSYDYRIAALSVWIAMLASYAAFELGGRVTAARGGARLAWLSGGATAMGIGIWSMHYTGMLAFRLPVPVWYDWPTVLLSLLPGVLASAVALFVVSRREMGRRQAVAASIFMGGGIGTLHYTGMAAMRLPAMCHYSPAVVALSVVVAVASSLLSLWLTFLFRDEASGRRLRKVASAALNGAGIATMHYTGMAAASYTPSAEVPDLSHAVNVSSLGAVGLSVVTMMVLGVAVVTSLVDRLQEQRALYDALFEQAPQAVILTNPDLRVVKVNREFTRMFGFTPEDTIGRYLKDVIVPDELRGEGQKHHDAVSHGQRVETEGVRQRKDGSRLHVGMVGVPISAPGGQIAAYAIYRDITARKRAEEELQRSLEQLRALAARLQRVREEERTRVAREIHDELGQALTAIKIDLANLISELPAEQKQPSSRAESILKQVDETILAVRRIATQLRPGILDDAGLAAAIEWAAEEFETRTGTKVRLDLPEGDLDADRERATALFRIFQETLTNVARHANATEVTVRLAREKDDFVLEVRDNGEGVSEDQLAEGGSLGILGMRERALLLGGELTILGAPGSGTTVRVRIPAPPPAPPEPGK